MNLIHRDMKPHNIMLNPATMEVKIIDFGLARAFDVKPTPLSSSSGTKFFIPAELMLGY